MTKEEFCSKCDHADCCNIYDFFITGTDDEIKLKHESFFKKEAQFGVKPLDRVNGRCEYFGKNGCIIKRENRPSQCLKYECDNLKRIL